jgi:hypothetical protein
VLLFHWSMLNYAALVKILKKHGALICTHAVLCLDFTLSAMDYRCHP